MPTKELEKAVQCYRRRRICFQTSPRERNAPRIHSSIQAYLLAERLPEDRIAARSSHLAHTNRGKEEHCARRWRRNSPILPTTQAADQGRLPEDERLRASC